MNNTIMTSVTDRKRGRACCPYCRRQQLPPAGAGRVAAQCPSFGRWLPQSAAARCTPYAPLSVGAVGCLVVCPGWSVALPASGLVVSRGGLPGWLLASGLVVIGEGCRAGCCSGGRISTKCSFSIVGLFLPSVAGSLSQSHAQLLRPTRGY